MKCVLHWREPKGEASAPAGLVSHEDTGGDPTAMDPVQPDYDEDQVAGSDNGNGNDRDNEASNTNVDDIPADLNANGKRPSRAGSHDSDENNGPQHNMSTPPSQARKGKRQPSMKKGAQDTRERRKREKVYKEEARSVVDPEIMTQVENDKSVPPDGRLARACTLTIQKLRRELAAAKDKAAAGDNEDTNDPGDEAPAAPKNDELQAAWKEDVDRQLDELWTIIQPLADAAARQADYES
ncbi:hypothetical protein ABEF95_015773 [Exophiala dermatitidis]